MTLFRPGKPYWLGKRTSTFPYVAPSGIVTFNSIESDGLFGASTSGSQVEIGVAGLWVVMVRLRRIAGAANGSFQAVAVLDGAEHAKTTALTSTGQTGSCASFMEQLEVGQVVQAKVLSGASSSLDTLGTGLELARIGPVRWT